MTTIT
jgi:hypothetical protein